jgi:hypothetical protein
MSIITDEYRCKLINKFLFADSSHEIQTFIYTAIKELKEHKVHPYIIKRFLYKTEQSLGEFKPTDYNSQQWTNIKRSKVALNTFKTSISDVIN